MSNFIENPEFHRLYLIRRHKGGSIAKRFEPGKIIDIEMRAAGIRIFHVRFQYDGKVLAITAYYGLVRELSDRWLLDEFRTRLAETKKELRIVEQLNRLVKERGISIE